MEKLNYKYIAQLLNRYWDGETTLEEERILKSFFEQNDVPEDMQPYKEYFCMMADAQDVKLDAGFDKRFDDIIAEEEGTAVHTKAIVIPFRKRLMPFLQAAAAVAVTLTIGGAALKGLMNEDEIDFGSNLTSETYVQKEDVQHVIETAQRTMTAKNDSVKNEVNPEIENPTE